MATSLKLYACGLFLFSLVSMHVINAGIDDNEVNDYPEYHMIQGVKVFGIDRECALVGGLCVHTSDCLEPTTMKGLCPSNAHRGVECCYELPMRSAPCDQHMGSCMDSCHQDLIRPGSDCHNGQVCCVLI